MSAYVLILTMIFKGGYGGMGRIESVDVGSLESCNRIGKAWINNASEKKNVKDGELKYLCIKRI